MRTLKKSLALVLVIALVLSFGVVGASAAFTDTKDSDYGTAIQVMTGIGVIDGMTDTTFEPTSSLTREQAAKIITFMLLGPTNASLVTGVTSQKFADVATTRWSAGYIEYCANLGIISGVGDNKFDPAGTLTTCAWTKMLLCALGYKATSEGLEGDSWAINTAALAVTAGVSDSSIVLSASTSCTREQACQLALKTLTAKTVQYTGGSEMTVGGITVINGATRSYVEYDTASTTAVKYNGVNDGYVQFCEKYFPKLSTETATAGGSTGVYWLYKGSYISGFVSDGTVLATSTNGTTLSNLTSASSTKYIGYKVDTDPAVTYYYNNFEVAVETSAIGSAATGSYAIGDYLLIGGVIYKAKTAITAGSTNLVVNTSVTLVDWDGKAGVIVNFLDGDSDSKYDAISVVQKEVAKVSGDVTTKTTGAQTTVKIPGVVNTATDTDDVSYPSDLAKGDVVLFYNSGDGVKYIEKAESVTGTMTGYTGGTPVNKISVDSTTYPLSDLAREDSTSTDSAYSTIQGLAGTNDVTFYLDDNGGICYYVTATASTAVDKVLFVAAVDKSETLGTYTAKALVVKSDGSTETITVKKVAPLGTAPATVTDADSSNVANDLAAGVLAPNTFYTYTTNSDGSYNLTSVETHNGDHHFAAVDTNSDIVYSNGAITVGGSGDSYLKLTSGKANFLSEFTNSGSWDSGTAQDILANSSTVFVLKTSTGYSVYTGIASMPTTFVYANGAKVDVMTNSSGYASMVVVGANSTTGGTAASGVILPYGGVSYVYDATNPYFTINAYVDGVDTVVKMDANNTLAAGTLYKNPVYSNGIISDATTISDNMYTSGDTVKVSNGVIASVDGSTVHASFVLSSSAVCYVYDSSDNTVTIIDAADLQSYLGGETVSNVYYIASATSSDTLNYVAVTVA